MSILGVNGALAAGAYQYADKAQKTNTNKVSFAKLAATKAAGKTENVSFKGMWQARFPGAYYNVMDTSKIDGSLWGRNDYPWDKYFSDNADASVLDWKPSGAEPAMLDSKVQAKINSTIGKKAIVVPPELEEKMNDRETAICSQGDRNFLRVCDELEVEYQHMAFTPIICEGDVIGSVLLLENDYKGKMGEVEYKLIMSAAGFLGRQMEQ